MELRRLNGENYDELIKLLNEVFTRENNRVADFERSLPNMCKRNDEYMGKHLGVFDGSRLVSVLGVYPLPGKIGDTPVMFSTTGNVATHWDYEGRGCMTMMLTAAMKELENIGADASRLGGLRQRYERWGFVGCGTEYDFTLTDYNIRRAYPDFSSELIFKAIKPDDTNALEFAQSIYEKSAISVFRRDFCNIIIAHSHIPYIALKKGAPVGYISSTDSGSVAEFFAVDSKTEYEMLLAFCRFLSNEAERPANLRIPVAPYRIDTLRSLGGIAECYTSCYPSRFKIINYEKILGALLRLKATYCELPKGEARVYIEGYGTVGLFVNNDGIGCRRLSDDKAPGALSLSYPEAGRFFFGPIVPCGIADVNPLLSSWLPLPLGWMSHDRV